MPDDPADDLRSRVLAVVRSLPQGALVTYGEVAAEAGSPGAARAVGRVLAQGHPDVPWWRVVTAAGRLVPHAVEEHATRLRAEGHTVVGDRVRT